VFVLRKAPGGYTCDCLEGDRLLFAHTMLCIERGVVAIAPSPSVSLNPQITDALDTLSVNAGLSHSPNIEQQRHAATVLAHCIIAGACDSQMAEAYLSHLLKSEDYEVLRLAVLCAHYLRNPLSANNRAALSTLVIPEGYYHANLRHYLQMLKA